MSLEYATTEDLIDELLSRCSCGIIKLNDVARAGGELQDGEVWCYSRYTGNITMNLGLVAEMGDFLIREQRKGL